MTKCLSFVLQMHCRGNPKFNFHRYMIRALEDDFKQVFGIRQVIHEIVCECLCLIFLAHVPTSNHAYFADSF